MGLRVGGLASGLDTGALVDALMGLERRPLDLLQGRKSELEGQRSLFRDLGTKLLALRDAAAAVDNRTSELSAPAVTEELLAATASSSDESVLGVRAEAGAQPGSYEVSVGSLARSARHVTTAFASDTAPVAAAGQTLTLTPVEGDPITVTVGAAGASLTELRDLVNTEPTNAGRVRAELLFDGAGYRLVLSGVEPGAANDLSVSTGIPGEGGAPFLDAALSVTATDAQLTAFGVPITRSSNTLADVIPGVALELRSTSAGPVQVQVTRDDEAIEARLQGLVDAYNDVRDFILEQSRFNVASERSGPLSGDSTLRGIEDTLARTLVASYAFDGNPLASLAQIGLALDSEGRVGLDSDRLREALADDPLAVRQLLSGDGTDDGVATALARAVDPITDPESGVLEIREDGFDSSLRSIDQQISRLEERLARREELLVARFTTLESTLAALQNQSSSLLSLASRSDG